MSYEHVWAILGVLCILSVFAMMGAGMRREAGQRSAGDRHE